MFLQGPVLDYNEYHSEDLQKVESNMHEIVKLEIPDSRESFDIMSSFVDNLPKGDLKNKMISALNRKKPFRNFNQIIHNCDQREQWFLYKIKMLEERILEIITDINLSRT